MKPSRGKDSCRWQIIAITVIRIHVPDQAYISTCLRTCPVPSEDLCTHPRFMLFLLLFSRLYKSWGRCLLHCNRYPALVSTPFTRFLLVLPPRSKNLSQHSCVCADLCLWGSSSWCRGKHPAKGWRGQLKPAIFTYSHGMMFYIASDCLLFHGSHGLLTSPLPRQYWPWETEEQSPDQAA